MRYLPEINARVRPVFGSTEPPEVHRKKETILPSFSKLSVIRVYRTFLPKIHREAAW